MIRILPVLLALTVGAIHVQPVLAASTDGLMWRYGEFMYAFSEKNWSEVCRFASESTKAGLGPNEEGCEGIKRVYGAGGQCWEDMLFALRQGCKTSSSAAGVTCVAPPQQADEAVVYLGARAGFAYNPETGNLSVTHLICGGD